MKFADHLNKKEINLFNELKKFPDVMKDKEVDKQQEQLSQRDWLELMGTNRDTFKRVRGAVKRR
ncbi:hypothetical protein AF332_07050 [Sporosarcina globispora]|uniref:Uncharacterized protein n=1 Tax=Sporosarcina globispora TaxID=1459 RepID=A0A0M0G9U2_SPOGL|nr:hypothetical protein [Sporosarcina globispora]KON86599.1 hypothetical protein AF332_07050 [Sporosarcina globispora]